MENFHLLSDLSFVSVLLFFLRGSDTGLTYVDVLRGSPVTLYVRCGRKKGCGRRSNVKVAKFPYPFGEDRLIFQWGERERRRGENKRRGREEL